MAQYAQTQQKEKEVKTSVDLYGKVAEQAKQQLEACQRFKQARIKDWQKTEDLYSCKPRPALRGRFNVPLPIMSGFLDTLAADSRERTAIEFGPMKNSSPIRAKKVTSAWEIDSDSQHANWNRKLDDGKKIAGMYGLAVWKIYSSSKPYKHVLEVVDPYDFIFEPLAGADLEKHLYSGEDNIYRSQYDLKAGHQYDLSQVSKLVTKLEGDNEIVNKDQTSQKNKANRYAALGLNGTFTGFRGDAQLRCAEMVTVYKGIRYYIYFHVETATWLKCYPLKEVYQSNLYPYVVFQPYRDPFNMLSKAPADDIRPSAESGQIIFNQILENRQKLNWGMRGYDPEIVTDPGQLEFRPDGLVEMNGLAKGVPLQNGIYEFKTPEIQGSINLFAYLDQFIGQKTGVTASAQGSTKAGTNNGVYFGDMQQVAKRMTLQSDAFSEAIEQLAIRYSWCLWEHMDSEVAVKILGEYGADWVTMTRDDASPDFTVVIKGGLAEEQQSELKKKQRGDTLTALTANPALLATLNPRWVAEQMLENAGFRQDDIRRGMDVKADLASENDKVNASQAIEDLLAGKKPKIYYSARQGFLKYLLDFYNNTELDVQMVQKYLAYFQEMTDVVAGNVARQAMMDASGAVAQSALQPLIQPETPMAGPVPMGQQMPPPLPTA